MKFTIEKQTLADALNRVTAAIEKRNTIPILANVLLTAKSDTVTIEGTDLELVAVANAPCDQVQSEGKITVSAELLSGIVSKIAKEDLIDIDLVDGFLQIKSGKSKFKLATLPADNYPNWADAYYNLNTTLDASALKAALARVAYSMSDEGTRYYLCGVYAHNAEDGLRFVATNGHTLAYASCGDKIDGFEGVIIPRKVITILQKALDFGSVDVSVSSNMICFSAGEWSITSKLVEGTYPDYIRVVPQGFVADIQIDVKSLVSATNRVAAVGDGKDKAMAFDFTPEGLELSMTTSAGQASDSIALTGNFEPAKIGLNYKYVLTTMAALDTDIATLRYKDPATPIVITDDGGLSVIMPMKLRLD
jgi:DNA polymerase III subunit beta